jgi:hypothetical protein
MSSVAIISALVFLVGGSAWLIWQARKEDERRIIEARQEAARVRRERDAAQNELEVRDMDDRTVADAARDAIADEAARRRVPRE